MNLPMIIFILFIPFYEGQFIDGIRTIVSSPEQAFEECKQADSYQTMPNGSKYAKLYKIDFEKGVVEEVEIPKMITISR